MSSCDTRHRTVLKKQGPGHDLRATNFIGVHDIKCCTAQQKAFESAKKAICVYRVQVYNLTEVKWNLKVSGEKKTFTFSRNEKKFSFLSVHVQSGLIQSQSSAQLQVCFPINVQNITFN